MEIEGKYTEKAKEVLTSRFDSAEGTTMKELFELLYAVIENKRENASRHWSWEIRRHEGRYDEFVIDLAYDDREMLDAFRKAVRRFRDEA